MNLPESESRRLEPFWMLAEQLVGKECWSALVVVGSIIDLDFGRKVELSQPIEKPKRLRPDQARFRGELNLEVGMASWILLRAGAKLCDSDDAWDQIEQGVRQLGGRRVTRLGPRVADFTDVALWFHSGLIVEFDDQYLLAIDFAGADEEDDEALAIRSESHVVTMDRLGGEIACQIEAIESE